MYVPPDLPTIFRRNCQECGLKIAPGKGLVCGNFGVGRRHWMPCQGAWHGNCYRQKDGDRFPIQSSKEEDELDFEEDDESAIDKDRIKVGRDGDHWICPFQCDLCHFQNIKQRNPGEDPRDEFFLLHIRRANLDALWAREPSTVEANRRECKHSIRANVAFGTNHQWDRLSGPHPVEDTWGMWEATSILLRSMDPGRTSEFIQHDTMRKLRSHYSNRYKANVHILRWS